MMTRQRDLITALCVIGLGLGLFWLGGQVRDFASAGIGAGFLPRIVAVLLVVLGAVLLLGARHRPVVSAADPEQEGGEWGGWPAVLASVGLMGAYVAALDGLGFILASSLYIFLQTLVLAKNARRRYLGFGLIGLGVSAGAYWLFVRVFQVMIPAGLLG